MKSCTSPYWLWYCICKLKAKREHSRIGNFIIELNSIEFEKAFNLVAKIRQSFCKLLRPTALVVWCQGLASINLAYIHVYHVLVLYKINSTDTVTKHRYYSWNVTCNDAPFTRLAASQLWQHTVNIDNNVTYARVVDNDVKMGSRRVSSAHPSIFLLPPCSSLPNIMLSQASHHFR